MHIPHPFRIFVLPVAAAVLVAACAGGGSAGWTYAPLGPTPSAAASADASAAPSGEPSPGGSGGPGTTVDISTPADNPLTYDPAEFTVPAGASVTLNYANLSNLPHDVVVFGGQDSSSEELGRTEVITGPDATSSAEFTAPGEAGDYFYWCSVHQSAMTGTYRVE